MSATPFARAARRGCGFSEKQDSFCPISVSDDTRSGEKVKSCRAESADRQSRVGPARKARYVFWLDDLSLADDLPIAPLAIQGHRQVTYAHLIALAVRHGGRLATFDRGTLDMIAGIDPVPVELLGQPAER